MNAQEFLDRADALAAAATDGPWVGPDEPGHPAAVYTLGEGVEGGGIVIAYDEYPRGGNRPLESLAFIAASRTLVPAMSAALRAVLVLHQQDPFGGTFCSHDGERWPCPTVRWIDQVLT